MTCSLKSGLTLDVIHHADGLDRQSFAAFLKLQRLIRRLLQSNNPCSLQTKNVLSLFLLPRGPSVRKALNLNIGPYLLHLFPLAFQPLLSFPFRVPTELLNFS